MTTTWLAVEPLDTVMVRDGRPFDAGAASSARAVPPPPNTLGGVAKAAIGFDVGRIVGPVVVTAAHGPMFPTPADVVRDDGRAARLRVAQRRADATSDLDQTHRFSHHLVDNGEPTSEWITRHGLWQWLAGENKVDPQTLVRDAAWVAEPRIGLTRYWDGDHVGTAKPGMLYAMSQLRPRDGTRFVIGCEHPDPLEVVENLVPLGGRGRLAEVSVHPSSVVFPPAPENFPGGRVAVYLATPALLAGTVWQPPGARLCAAAVPGPVPIASANPRGAFMESRQLLWAVPAGSVFYLQFDGGDEGAALAWSREHHGGLLPHASELRIVTSGFGTCLTGRW